MQGSNYGFVYETTNLVNGKKYIGLHRWSGSEDLDQFYVGTGKLLLRAIYKYGRENFKRDILQWYDSEEELLEGEKDWIARYNAVEDTRYYNLCKGGRGVVSL